MKKRILLYTAIILTSSFFLNSCYFDGSSPFKRIEGEGPMVTEELELSKVSGIVLRNSMKVTLTQGDNQKVVVEGQQNIIDNIKHEVSNGILYIGNKQPVWRTQPLKIKIRLSDLQIVKVSGSGDVITSNTFEGLDDLEVRLSGSGGMNLSVEAKDINGNISGSGRITLNGEARDVDFGISGSGSIHASDLEAKNAYARISGSGGIHLNVEKELEGRISGRGNITYLGNPRVEKHISGSGNVRSK